MTTKILLLLAILVLAGCASTQPVVESPTISDTVYVYQDCGVPPPREHIFFVPITWQVIGGRFTLSTEEYKKLAYNMTENAKGVAELKLEIKYYLKCLDHGI
jgi:hypothetical protein